MSGGMPGAYLVIRAADGRVTVVDEGGAAALVAYDRPVLPLDADDLALYLERVLATDPVALAHPMRAIGPVQVPGGERLTAAKTVSALLSRVYAERTAEAQDRYFSAAARAIFQALRTRPVAPERCWLHWRGPPATPAAGTGAECYDCG